MSIYTDSDEKIEVELEVNVTPSLAHILDENPGLFAESTESLIKAAIMNSKEKRTKNVEDHILNKFSKISPTAIRRCASVLKMQTNQKIPKAGVKLRIKNSMVKLSSVNLNSHKGFVCSNKNIRILSGDDEGNESDSENLKPEMFLYEDTKNELNSKTCCLSDRSIMPELIPKLPRIKTSIGDTTNKINENSNKNEAATRLVTFIDDQQEQNLGPFARKTISSNHYERWMEDMKKMDEKIDGKKQIVLSNSTSRTKLSQPLINKYTNSHNLKSVKNKHLTDTIENNSILENESLKNTIPKNDQKTPNTNITQELINKCYEMLRNNSTPLCQNSINDDQKISAQFVYEIISFFNKDKPDTTNTDDAPTTSNAMTEQVVYPTTIESTQTHPRHKHAEQYSKKMTKLAKNPPKLSSESGQSRELRTYNFLKCLSPNVDESEPCYCSNCMATTILSESEKRPYIERPHRSLNRDLISQNNQREPAIQEILPKSSSLNKTKFNMDNPEYPKKSNKGKEEKSCTLKPPQKETEKNINNPSMQTIYSSKTENETNKLPKMIESEVDIPEKKNFIKSILSKLKNLENKVRALETNSPKNISEMKLQNVDIKVKSDIPANSHKHKEPTIVETIEPDPQPSTSSAKPSQNYDKKIKMVPNLDKNIQVDLSISELESNSTKSDVSGKNSNESKLIQIHYTDTPASKRSQDKSNSSNTTRSSKNNNLSLSSKISEKHKALSRTSNSFMVLVDSKPSDFNVKKKIQEIIEYKLLKIKKDLYELRYLNQVVLNDSEYFTQKDLFPAYKEPLSKITEKSNSTKSKSPVTTVKDSPNSSVYNDITQNDSTKKIYSVTLIPKNKISINNITEEKYTSYKDLINNHVTFTKSKQSLEVVTKPSETLTRISSKCTIKTNDESLANKCMRKFKSSIPRLKRLPQKLPFVSTVDRIEEKRPTKHTTKIGKLIPPPSVKVNKQIDMKFNSPFPDISERTVKNRVNNRQLYVYHMHNTEMKKTEYDNTLSNDESTKDSLEKNKTLTNSSTKYTMSTDSVKTMHTNSTKGYSEPPKLVTIVPDTTEEDSSQFESEMKTENESSGDTKELRDVKNKISSMIDDFDSLLNETIDDIKKNNETESSQHTFRIKSDISFSYKDNHINEMIVNKSIIMQTKSNVLENIKQNCSNLLNKISIETIKNPTETTQNTSTDITELNASESRKKSLYNNDEKPIIVQEPLKSPLGSIRNSIGGSIDSKHDSSNNDFMCCCPVLFKKKGEKKNNKQNQKQISVPQSPINNKDDTLTDNSIEQCFALWEDIYNNVTMKKKDGPSTVDLNKKLLKYRFHDNSGLHEINITLDDLKKILRARAAVINDTNDTDDESSIDYQ